MTDPTNEGGRSTRRQFVVRGIGGVTSMSLLLAACGGDDEPASPEAESSGPWRHVDGRGNEISLEARPKRIVMQEYVAASMIPFGIKPVGIFGSVPLGELPVHEGMDLSGVESLGEVWGEVNLEAMAALQPDLVISGYWPSTRSESSDIGFGSDRLLGQVEELAPLAGVLASDSAGAAIERYEELATSLGANAKIQAAARKQYEEAIADLKAALEENPGVSVIGVSASADNIYVAKSADFPDTADYVAWGLEFTDAGGSESYFDMLSWENADKYPSDLIMYDARTTTQSLEDTTRSQPTWRTLPAVKADQVTPWHMEAHTTYERYAGHIKELAAAIRSANADVVS